MADPVADAAAAPQVKVEAEGIDRGALRTQVVRALSCALRDDRVHSLQPFRAAFRLLDALLHRGV